MRALSSLFVILLLTGPSCLRADDYKAVRPSGSEKKSLTLDVPPGYEVMEASRRRVRLARTDKAFARRQRLRLDAVLPQAPILAPWAPNAPGG